MVVLSLLVDCYDTRQLPSFTSTWDSYWAILVICGSSTTESGFGCLTRFTLTLRHSRYRLSGFLISSTVIRMDLDDRQGFTARSAMQKKMEFKTKEKDKVMGKEKQTM